SQSEPPQVVEASASSEQNTQANSSSATNSATANAEVNENRSSSAQGASRPDDAMSRRALMTGQCSSCKPLNLKIDEWAGSFDGQMRRKLEIAIEDYLQRLDAALVNAERSTQTAIASFEKEQQWNQAMAIGVRKIIDHLIAAGQIAV